MQINGNGQGYAQIIQNDRPASQNAMMHKDGEKLGKGEIPTAIDGSDNNETISFEDVLKTNNGKSEEIKENNNKSQNKEETSKSIQDGALEGINILA